MVLFFSPLKSKQFMKRCKMIILNTDSRFMFKNCEHLHELKFHSNHLLISSNSASSVFFNYNSSVHYRNVPLELWLRLLAQK